MNSLDEMSGQDRWRLVDALNYLTSGTADSVTFMQQNEDPPPGNKIVCCGEWTSWQDWEFAEDTVLACLQAAYDARRAAGEGGVT